MNYQKIALIIVAIAVFAGAWWLAAPLFFDRIVNDELPRELQEPISLNLPNQESFFQGQPTPEEMAALPMEERLKKSAEYLESLPQSKVEVDDSNEAIMNSEQNPQLIKSGSFVDADSFHKAAGEAKIYQQKDGSFLLRLENLNVTNGPDLVLYLVDQSGEVNDKSLEISALKGNMGNQNYLLSNEIKISDFAGVKIYCRAFSVPFGLAKFN